MPYTPPSARSPATSKPQTPSLSRSHSHSKNDKASSSHDSHTDLPRSSSSKAYMSKHRRSPSITKSPPFNNGPPTPDITPPEKISESEDEDRRQPSSRKTRLSPSNRSNTSTEASPPASPQTSSDDDNTVRRGRSRDTTKLAELEAAIRIIEQHRAGSPSEEPNEVREKARKTLGLPGLWIGSLGQVDGSQSEHSPRPPLSAGARKISHSRSSTDASAFVDFPRNKFNPPSQSVSDSEMDELDDDELVVKPPLIRKKSGELVRPALRASSTKRRPSSMPGTPTYSKAVHFQDNSLEHVRHFLQVDKPIAVSAGSSPVDSLDDESKFPFGGDDSTSRSPPFDWEIQIPNFPRDTVERQMLPVRTEKVYLSPDTKILTGSVAVRNLAFHKLVVARFTLDYWKTTSEVVAEYSNDVRRRHADDGCDRFAFNIRLEDQANLENKTMYFCVRYSVNGQDFWDNNNSMNYQIDFSKKFKPQNGKQGMQPKSSRPLNALPRSKQSAPRPRSMPSFDDFANLVSPYEFLSFPQPSAMVGESPIRFKNKASSQGLFSDTPGPPNQQAFGNRYDFSASLSAARQSASSSAGDREGSLSKDEIKSTEYKSRAPDMTEAPNKTAPNVSSPTDAGKVATGNNPNEPVLTNVSKPKALTTEKPPLQSSSYHELLDKYCFFGSGKPSSQSAKPAPSQVDGASDDLPKIEDLSVKRTEGVSPPQSRNNSPVFEERKASSTSTSTRASRSASPVTGPSMGSRPESPVSFGYPYQPMQTGLFDTHTPTAIRG